MADCGGNLEPGKDADVAVWSGHPLAVMSRVEQAYIEGELVYQFDRDALDGRFPVLDTR